MISLKTIVNIIFLCCVALYFPLNAATGQEVHSCAVDRGMYSHDTRLERGMFGENCCYFTLDGSGRIAKECP